MSIAVLDFLNIKLLPLLIKHPKGIHPFPSAGLKS
jgi:hypothetical protein